jgi:ADP-ribose pyrophosphatase
MPDAVTLSTRTAYEGRIFRVTVERVRLPHGAEVDMEVVHHPGSVVLIVVPQPDAIVLVKQYRHCAGRDLWEVPAGSLSHGEDPETGARRECHEEVGLVPRRVELVTTLWPTPGFCTEKMLFYRCTGLERPSEAAEQDEDEFVVPQTFTLTEARDMVARGEIADMKTVVSLMYVGARL